MDKKKLSAARKKLEEYKQSKGVAVPPGTGTNYSAVNEKEQSPISASSASSGYQNGHPISLSSTVPPPPTSAIPVYLDNLGQQLQGPPQSESHSQAHPVDNPLIYNATNEPPTSASLIPVSTESTETVPCSESGHSSVHPVEGQQHQILHCVPSAPPLVQMNGQGQNDGMSLQGSYQNNYKSPYTDAGQDFPVNFFQPAIVAREYQPVSFNSVPQTQDFYYSQPQAPLFYSVDGNNVKPLQPYQMEGAHQVETYDGGISHSNSSETQNMNQQNSQNPFNFGSGQGTDVESHPHPTEQNQASELPKNNENSGPPTSMMEFQSPHDPQNNEELVNIKEFNPIVEQLSPIATEEGEPREMPTLRRTSVSSQDEKDRLELQAFQRMKSVQDALELQLEELRRDNSRLLNRQAELVAQIEENEMSVQELRRERDRSKEEAKKLVQPLHAKINNLYEENQRIMKNSNEVGMELRVKLQEKSKQYEDMEQAFIVVTKKKMDLAAELDQERERGKELETIIVKKDEDIIILRGSCSKLEEKLKAEQQKEVLVHQLEDQRRHFVVQTETLQGELNRANNKIKELQSTSIRVPGHLQLEESSQSHQHDHQKDTPSFLNAPPSNSGLGVTTNQEHDHNEGCGDHGHEHGHSHDHEHDHGHTHDHDHDHGHTHDHDHDHGHTHDHDHSHDHDHDHGHTHDHDHSHDHEHDHSHSHDHGHERPPTDEFAELKKRMHHLEWENTTFRADVEKLAVEAKEKKQYEEKYNQLKEQCDKLYNECQRLESLVVQLQGENDTIGDYIALYQTQRLALKESAKEKDVQLETLAKEREVLLAKMAELTQLLKALKGPRNGDEASQTAAHLHCEHTSDSQGNPEHAEIEGKIRNLLTEIRSSNLIENFHPCAVCSGRLMNV